MLFVGPLQLLNSLGCSEKWAGCRFKLRVVKKNIVEKITREKNQRRSKVFYLSTWIFTNGWI